MKKSAFVLAVLVLALTGAFLGSPDAAAQACTANDTTLCLNSGRFEVRAVWELTNGTSGQAHAVALTPDTGYFWFFDQENVELIVKVLNGCGLNSRYWVFAGGLTNVRTTITV